jgi:CysZ protein
MLDDLGKSLAQLFAPELRRVLWKILGVTVLVFGALWFGVGWLIGDLALTDSGWLAQLANWLVGLLGGALGVVVTLVLFAPVATMVAGLFQDEVADAVEARHYPDLAPTPGQPIGRALAAGLRLVVWTVVVNLLCLPLYLLPIANIAIFFAINGYLLSREYFEVVALRRLDARAASAFRRRHRTRLWLAGVVVALAFWVPVANLLAPILGTALFVHVVERCRRRGVGAAPAAGVLSG